MPNWTQKQQRSRTVNQLERVMAIIALLLTDDIDLSNKSEAARRLGISRHTLDRDLALIESANDLADEYRMKLKG